MRYTRLEGHSSEKLNEFALGADSTFALILVKHDGTPSEALSYLVRKEIFNIPVMARRDGETSRKLDKRQQRELWTSALMNPALGSKDAEWIKKRLLQL